MAEIRIRHVGLEVKRMIEMISFYKKLGFEKFWDRVEKPEHTGFKEDVRTVKLRDSRGCILEFTENHPYKNHVAFGVSYGKKAVTWLRDPDGNVLEVVNEELL